MLHLLSFYIKPLIFLLYIYIYIYYIYRCIYGTYIFILYIYIYICILFILQASKLCEFLIVYSKYLCFHNIDDVLVLVLISLDVLQVNQRPLLKDHKVSKIFNKNTIKLSWSCYRNIDTVISSHNQRTIQPQRSKAECSLDNKCLTANIVCKAVVSAPTKIAKKYFCVVEVKFKDGLSNHATDFCHKKYVNSTKLCIYIQRLKDEKITHSIKWNIMSIVHGTPKGGVCKLFLTDKFWILKHFND